MVHVCWAVGCHNRSTDPEKRSFHSIPVVRNNEGEETRNLSEERRRQWLANIGRKVAPTKYSKVCSDHFTTGKPAELYNKTHPDWSPTLKLGWGSNDWRKEDRHDRFRRAEVRSAQQLRSEVSKATLDEPEAVDQDSLQQSPQAEHVCSFFLKGTLENVRVNTATTQSHNTSDQMQLHRLRTENTELRKKVANLTLTQESLETDDDKVKYYTGLPSYSVLLALYDFTKDYIPEGRGPNALSKFQKLLLVLMRLRLNTPVQDLAYRFGLSRSTVSRVFLSVLHVLYIRLKVLIHWPEREELWLTMPMEFRKYFGRKVAVIIDCFEIFIERPSNLMARAQTWSNYKHHNTVKFLIGITPQGSVSYISSAWGGRTSDKEITENCGMLNRLCPGDIVLADRGFNIAESVGVFCAELKIPSFTKGRAQLSALDVETTRKIAHVRIHVERVIGLVRNKYTMLRGTLPVDFLNNEPGDVPVVDKIVTVACALTNMCPSVVPFD